VDDQQVAAVTSGGGERRAHAAQRGVLPASLDQDRADLLNDFARAPLHFRCVVLIYPEDPVRDVQGQIDKGADGQPACNLAGGMAAHPIGDDHHVVDFVRTLGHVAGREARQHCLQRARRPGDQEVILVVGSHVAHMRQGADIDVQRR
jgi:hypothetical protein